MKFNTLITKGSIMKTTIIAGLLTLAMASFAAAAPLVTLTGSYDATNWYVFATESLTGGTTGTGAGAGGIAYMSFRVGG